MGAGGWMSALGALADATGSMRAQLVGFGGSRALPFNWITNIADREIELFGRIDGHSPTINFRVAADQVCKQAIASERDYDAVRGQLADDSYVDFCEQAQMPFGCQTMLVRGEAGAVGLALLRSRADGKTDDAIRDTFRQAASAARIAVRLQVALEQQGSALIGGALEAMSAACLLFDRSGRICTATPAAEARLAGLERLRVRDGRLVADDHHVTAQIDGAFASLSAPEGPAHATLHLRGANGQRETIRFDVFRTRRRDWSLGFEPCFIGVLDPGDSRIADHAVLSSTFGFTAAESAIAAMLVQGRSRQDIASRRQVTVETLRGQLKTLYSKTGCRREAELVALIGQMRG